jgi:phage terminase large subunit GpA-like protein
MTFAYKKASFRSLEEMVASVADLLQPPDRLTVSEAAAEYRYINNPPAYVGKWSNEKTPYLVEVMDTMTSLEYQGIILVGPARIGKSDLFYNWLTHSALCDPADMIFYAMTREVARDLSQGDLGKVMRHTTALGDMLVKGRNNDNVFDKRFRNGMRLLMRWPTITELSGKTLPRVWFADYDRVEDADDIAKEGPMFDLGMKRTTTYKRFAMTVAESSPGRPIDNPKYILSSPHEAPPAKGILGLYNRGDRRRRYWRCAHCRTPFEPSFKLFCYPDSSDFMEAAEAVTLQCPHCEYQHTPDLKRELDANDNARWIQDYVTWHKDGSITGRPRKTNIASFWLKGPCAAFQTWQSLIFNFLQAKAAFDSTGDEGPLKKTITTDQGEAYVPKALEAGRSPESLMEQARNWGSTKAEPTVPAGVRFLIATVDVQSGARAGFVVQITGFGVGGDATVIDMFRILKSERLDEDGEHAPMAPESYVEDWDLIKSRVMEKSYPLADGSGRRMSVKLTGCDYGGADGVSVHAREFWRKLALEGLEYNFLLVKGEPSKTAPHVQLKYPDANQKDQYNAARGDVPVLFINSLEVKDMLSGLLGRTKPGGGMWTFPQWAPAWFYSQMTTEVRTDKGWEKPKNNTRRNEAWDLSYYALALLRSPEIRAHRQGFWDAPPPWALDWDENVLIFGASETKPAIRDTDADGIDLAELGRLLA